MEVGPDRLVLFLGVGVSEVLDWDSTRRTMRGQVGNLYSSYMLDHFDWQDRTVCILDTSDLSVLRKFFPTLS